MNYKFTKRGKNELRYMDKVIGHICCKHNLNHNVSKFSVSYFKAY